MGLGGFLSVGKSFLNNTWMDWGWGGGGVNDFIGIVAKRYQILFIISSINLFITPISLSGFLPAFFGFLGVGELRDAVCKDQDQIVAPTHGQWVQYCNPS